VAKTTLADDVLVVGAEHVVTEGSALSTLVVSSLELVLTAVNLWHETLAEIVGSEV
jgi:hypothetical protein